MADLRSKVVASTNKLKEQLLEAVGKLESSTARENNSLQKKPFVWGEKHIFGGKRNRVPQKGRNVKKSKISTWTHTFVCLSRSDQEEVPDIEERGKLQIAGLGEQKISIQVDADNSDINEQLHYHFQKLQNAGGFEMLRMADHGMKVLQGIPIPPKGYTVPYLKAVVHNAKIYLRPLQKNLDIDFCQNEQSSSSPPKEVCLSCGDSFCIPMLREHLQSCGNNKEVLESSPVCPPDTTPVNSVLIVVVSDSDSEDSEFQLALKISREEALQNEARVVDEEPKSVGDIVKGLIKAVGSDDFDMIIRRGYVLDDSLRRMNKMSFDPYKTINVKFVGEEGIDTGGLTREFFRLVFQELANRYLETSGCFSHNAVALQDNVYYQLGQLTSMCLTQGGAPIHLFCPSVFSFLCGMKPSDIVPQIEEVPNKTIQDTLNEIMAAQDTEALRSILESFDDVIIESGFTKPLARVSFTDRPSIVQTVTLHYVVLRSLAELQQYCDGMGGLLLKALSDHGDLLRPFFSNEKGLIKPLSADSLIQMFKRVVHSEKGSNERSKEEDTFIMFLDYLEKCERVSNGCHHYKLEEDHSSEAVSLENVLSFFTGADAIPPLGFPHDPKLNFSPTSPYPTASTCAIELTLPTIYNNLLSLKKK